MTEKKPTCFIAMPITVHDEERALYGDAVHWTHVLDHLFVPAVEAAGYEAIRPSAPGTAMIHGRIVQHLVAADLVLCDLSRHNPNVLFELGVRTSVDKPVTLVKDEYLGLPFDINGLNTHQYDSALPHWDMPKQVDLLAAHLRDTKVGEGETNPLWRHFGVQQTAHAPSVDISPLDAKIELLTEKIDRLERTGSAPFRGTGYETLNDAIRRFRIVLETFAGIQGPPVITMGANGTFNARVATEFLNESQLRTLAARISTTLGHHGLTAALIDDAQGVLIFDVFPTATTD